MIARVAAVVAAGVLLAGCGGKSGKDIADEIRPDLRSQLDDRGLKLGDLSCVKTNSGGTCIAGVSDDTDSSKVTITVTQGDDGYIWSVDS